MQEQIAEIGCIMHAYSLPFKTADGYTLQIEWLHYIQYKEATPDFHRLIGWNSSVIISHMHVLLN